MALQGITTDGSALYPEPIRTVFGEVAHQICTFHVLKELTQGILRAVAAERDRLAKSKPKLKRGRPSSKEQAARRLARKSKQIQEKIRGLFQDRFLFVKRRLKPSERKRLVHITRGLPQLRKFREIMEHIYALFDRRCRTQTALGKLKKLRQWVNRFTVDWRDLKKGLLTASGKSPDISRRHVVARDLQCGGTWQSPPPEDAKECVPGPQQGLFRGSHCSGHAPRIASRRPRANHSGVTPGTQGIHMTQNLYYSVQKEQFSVSHRREHQTTKAS